jgi:hypothetical protein
MLRTLLLSSLAVGLAGPALHSARGVADVPASIALAVAGRASAHPSIAADGAFTVVAWAARGAAGTDIMAAASADGGATFAAPVRVNDVADGAVANAERPPRVAIAWASGRRTIGVLWIGAAVPPAGPRILLSQSADDGRTFGAPIALSAGGAPGIRGWGSLAAGRDGTWHAAWLDGREAAAGATTAAAGGHAHHRHDAGGAAGAGTSGSGQVPRMGPQQDLYHAVVGRDGTVREARLAADVCFCCKTAILVPPAALAEASPTFAGDAIVAWRHIYPDSERDIALAIRSARTGVFAPPVRVSPDRWQLQACPDDGPALAASGTGRLHVVWPTQVGSADAPEKGIFHARTTDGKTFSPRRRLDDPGTGAAHPQIAANEVGDAIALWDESGGGGRRVVARSLSDPSTPQRLGPGTHPVAAAAADGFVAAWTSGTGDASVIRVGRVAAR